MAIINGDNGNNVLFGEDGDDLIRGFAGDDRLNGLGGDDTLDGGQGDDTLLGGDGDDLLRGRNGDDRLQGGEGNDDIRGGAGNDQLIDDIVGAGPTVLTDNSYNGNGLDSLFSIERVRLLGDSADNVVNAFSFSGSTSISTADGDDIVIGSDLSSDRLFGGNDNDLLIGNGGADSLVGGAGDDWLVGGFGVDTLRGGAGNDTLDGGEGPLNTLEGGSGDDIFVIRSNQSQFVTDFQLGVDQFRLGSGLNFSDLSFNDLVGSAAIVDDTGTIGVISGVTANQLNNASNFS